MLKLFLIVFLIAGLSGCATGARKQSAQAPTVNYDRRQASLQESYKSDEDDYDTWSSDTYEKPVAKSYSDQTAQLSSKQIQRALKNAGYYQGPIDGKIGPKTKEAIIKFQKAKGLKADGIVGKRTSAELNKYLSR